MLKCRRILWSIILIVSVWSFWAIGYTQQREPDVHFVPTPEEVVMEMLKMAQVTPNDIVYDLGCGDGRIVITAAKVFGARGPGVDIDPVRIQESTENAHKAGVTDRVKFIEQDLFKIDIREATIVTLYLLEELNLRLRPKLFRELRPGTRIVSHEFGMEDWKPDNMGMVRNMKLYYNPQAPHEKDTYFYYWVIPADVAGVWRWTMSTSTGEQPYALRLAQKFQEISGKVNVNGREVTITDTRLIGNQFTFRNDINRQKVVMRFNGHISGDTIKGNVEVQGGSFEGHYNWTAKRNP